MSTDYPGKPGPKPGPAAAARAVADRPKFEIEMKQVSYDQLKPRLAAAGIDGWQLKSVIQMGGANFLIFLERAVVVAS